MGDASLILCDVTPRQFVAIAGSRLPDRFRRQLEAYRYGPGVFKMDWALSAPIPWKAAECARAGTVHVGGSLDEIAASERTLAGTAPSERPFVLVAQPSLFDASRAPAGQHTAWAYCHVPHASTADMTERIESQVERFAPGFRARILARSIMTPADLERHNANLVGGDITGGAQDLRQLVLRPTPLLYRTPLDGVYLCSVIHAARRRRARHVRISRGARGLCAPAIHHKCIPDAGLAHPIGVRRFLYLAIAAAALLAPFAERAQTVQDLPRQAGPVTVAQKWQFFVQETFTPLT